MALTPLFGAPDETPPAPFASLYEAPAAAPFAAGWLAPPPAPPPPEPPPVPVPTPEELLARAQAEAEALVATARREADRQTGAAVAAAREEARAAERAAFAAASGALLGDLQEQWAARLVELERDLARLVTDVAEKVVRQHLALAPEAVLAVAREAVQRLEGAARVQLVVAPAEEALVRQAQAELAALLAPEARLEVRVDAQLTPGGCLAQGDRGSVDARLETRLEACDRVLREAVA